MPSKTVKTDAEVLGTQLQSQGYLSTSTLRIMTLPLFTPPSTSSSNVLTAFAAYRTSHQKALDQLTKCLWNVLNAKSSHQETLEKLAAKEQVLEYELERTKALLEREQRKSSSAEQEREAEKAKTRTAERSLATERERARAARDELAKSKSQLAAVRQHALQEAKRHEAELAAANARSQRATSEPSFNRMVMLNPIARRVEPSMNAEVELLENALNECDEARKEAERECVSLRELVKEVRDWTEGVAGIRGIPALPAEPKPTGPFPHITMPYAVLRSQTLARLDHLSAAVSTIVRTVDQQIIDSRVELEDLLEAERIGRAEEKARTADAQIRCQELERNIGDLEAQLSDAEAIASALRGENEALQGDSGEQVRKLEALSREKDALENKVSTLEANLKEIAKRQEQERKRFEAEQAKRAARVAEKSRVVASIDQSQAHSSHAAKEIPSAKISDENQPPARTRSKEPDHKVAKNALASILALGESPASVPMSRDRPALAPRTRQASSTPTAHVSAKPGSTAKSIVERVRREREERQRVAEARERA